MRLSSPFRNRNYTDPAAHPVEGEVEELRKRVERLESLVNRLDRTRRDDDLAIGYAKWQSGRYGIVPYVTLAGVLAILAWTLLRSL